MVSLSTNELAAIYSEAFESTLAQLKGRGLDPQNPEVRKTAREVANQAINRALRD
ncbi:hypothetical protein [Acaryochloris thomasi]|uniref:hypothetical protein n=1 Tax=Acaryochloris thomasi TaxID=2929456 RepID=UPI001314D210|nr:hypothetical protein [Acaryochloris thomasi]